eukprot:CAMPEP_0179102108 /NCGR_PEP_ID=MMETSP0796-20121207/47244_1 /TAXON_ID=73915 /ORGANISM="Pyrodinium bahamense, Strain pbaha01" /LENGTH=75 /DNA_ID=CAMNT_0020799977 /DNA_START=127 /DNA_END=351 /DNA_ORIENTATION=-
MKTLGSGGCAATTPFIIFVTKRSKPTRRTYSCACCCCCVSSKPGSSWLSLISDMAARGSPIILNGPLLAPSSPDW